jgi:hypothetical protein
VTIRSGFGTIPRRFTHLGIGSLLLRNANAKILPSCNGSMQETAYLPVDSYVLMVTKHWPWAIRRAPQGGATPLDTFLRARPCFRRGASHYNQRCEAVDGVQGHCTEAGWRVQCKR